MSYLASSCSMLRFHQQVGLLEEQATAAFITWMVVAKGQLAPETHAGA